MLDFHEYFMLHKSKLEIENSVMEETKKTC